MKAGFTPIFQEFKTVLASQKVRFAVGICGVLGSIAVVMLGMEGTEWLLELKRLAPFTFDYDTLEKSLYRIHAHYQMAVYWSYVCGLTGLVFSIRLILHRETRWLNAILLIGSGGIPLVLWGTLSHKLSVGLVVVMPMTPLIISGLLALWVSKKSPKRCDMKPSNPAPEIR